MFELEVIGIVSFIIFTEIIYFCYVNVMNYGKVDMLDSSVALIFSIVVSLIWTNILIIAYKTISTNFNEIYSLLSGSISILIAVVAIISILLAWVFINKTIANKYFIKGVKK